MCSPLMALVHVRVSITFNRGIIYCFTPMNVPLFQRLSSVKEEGYKAGQLAGFTAGQEAGFTAGKQAGYKAEVERETPQMAPQTAPPSPEEVQMKVKAIMNQTYQTLAAKFKTKETFESREILSILVTTIKVAECRSLSVMVSLSDAHWSSLIAGDHIEVLVSNKA